MMHDTSYTSTVHQWIFSICPEKEGKLPLMAVPRSSRALTRGHRGPRRRCNR